MLKKIFTPSSRSLRCRRLTYSQTSSQHMCSQTQMMRPPITILAWQQCINSRGAKQLTYYLIGVPLTADVSVLREGLVYVLELAGVNLNSISLNLIFHIPLAQAIVCSQVLSVSFDISSTIQSPNSTAFELSNT